MQIWIKKLSQKKEGSTIAIDVIPLLFTVVVLGMILVIFSSWVANFDSKNKVDLIAREYILKMETLGYLGIVDQAELIEKLEECQLSNISLSGTTTSQVAHGQKVTLKITGDLLVTDYRFLEIFSLQKDIQTKQIAIEKSVTSLS